MQASRLRLGQNLQELRGLLDLVDLLDDLRQSTPEIKALEPLLGAVSTATWRRQVYSFSIIFAYGAHERFIRDYLRATAKMMAGLYKTYADMPDKVRTEHARLSASSIREITDRNPHDADELLAVMARFADSLGGQPVLNDELFAKHTANFRSDVVQQSFARLALQLTPVEVPVPALFTGVHGSLESIVDDLANRRNDVAHGGDVDVVDIATIRAMIDALDLYLRAIRTQVSRQLLQGLLDREAIPVGTVSHVWSNKATGERTVGRVADLREVLRVGRSLYDGKSLTRYSVKSIQCNRMDLDLAQPDGSSYGVDLGAVVTEGTRLFMLPLQWASKEGLLMKQATGD